MGITPKLPGDDGTSTSKRPHIAIIGAGAAGLCMAMRLKTAGFTSFVLYEAADRLGGTWRANTYPGAACDIPAHLYSFSFAPNPDWTRKFAPQPEIEAYLNRCADDHGLRAHIRFNTEICGAHFDAATDCWRLEIVGGSEELAHFLVCACGQLNRPHIPNFNGRMAFKGSQFHSARWPRDARVNGTIVAVIGSAATAIQIVPEIAPQASRVLVFQRASNWIARKRDRAYSTFERMLYKRLPVMLRLVRSYHFWRHELRYLTFRQHSLMSFVYHAILKARVRRKQRDPTLRVAVTPDYPVGCKRVLFSNDWFQTLERPNVELVTSPIEGFTSTAIETADGRTHPVDTVIYATGFETTRYLAPMQIMGANGLTIEEVWSEGARAHRGMTVAGFPNLFMLNGPTTNLAHNSVQFMVECQVRYIISCIESVIDRGAATLAVKPDQMAASNKRLRRRLSGSVWAAGCSNWYKNTNGLITNNWSGPAFRYWLETRRVDLDELSRRAPGLHFSKPPQYTQQRWAHCCQSSNEPCLSARANFIRLSFDGA
ncbi:MAG: NAD(P)/FAD-dependent oxidoreductase [Alphaproteobacteria bacterium]